MSETKSDKRSAAIVISDMHAPVLSELQAAALAAAKAHPVTLTEEAVLDAARANTGLSDFGADDFRHRLRLWLKGISLETNLTELAKAGMYGDLVRLLSTRLRVEDTIKRHPEILDIVIDRPLVVAGLPRSGTTYLQNFLSADPQLRSLPYWEAIAPVPTSPEENGDTRTDPRWARANELWKQSDAMLPYLKMVHPFDPNHISEDIELHALDITTYLFEWHTPNWLWYDYYAATDQTSSFRYLKRVLQVLTFFRGPNRWLMKCPQHMEQLATLHKVFPDATIVLNHRDPVASIQSALTSMAYSSRIRTTSIDTKSLVAYWIPRYEKLLRACVRDRDTLPANQVVDVYFHELMADPMRVVEGIYATAQLPVSDALRARWTAFLKENVRGKHGSLDYNLRRDFGLDPADVRKGFDFYFKRFPVRVEVT
jgi:hypothetical protein